MNTDENLSKIFGTDLNNDNVVLNVPAIQTEQNTDIIVSTDGEKDSAVDYDADYARSKMVGIIDVGEEAIDLAGKIASESMHPRALEVMSQLLKTQGDNIDRILKIQRDRREIKKINGNNTPERVSSSSNVNVANAVFIGSTSELLKRLKGIGAE